MEIKETNQPQAEVTGQETAQPTPDVVDLDGLSSFKFQGQDFTPDKLSEIYRGYQTLSEQREQTAKEQQFVDNLSADIANVVEGRASAQAFKSTYPAKFHALLDQYTKAYAKEQTQPNATSSEFKLPREFQEKIDKMEDRLKFYDQRAYQSEVQAAQAKLEAVLPPLYKKYPMAIEDQVLARGEAMLNAGQQLTDKAWERLVRESHESVTKRADGFYSEKLKAQIEAGQKGKDTAAGGSTPGQAPVRSRNFDDAREAMLKHVQAGGR